MLKKQKRKYKIGEKFIPKNESMFWREYKIINDVVGSHKDRQNVGFSYIVECKPVESDKENQTINIVESFIDSHMLSTAEKVEYKIKIVGEYAHKGIKVSVTEKDSDTGMEVPYFTASVWTDKTPELQENEFVLKNYSENEGLDSLLLTHGVIELVGETAIVGRCECPVVRLTKKNNWFAEPL